MRSSKLVQTGFMIQCAYIYNLLQESLHDWSRSQNTNGINYIGWTKFGPQCVGITWSKSHFAFNQRFLHHIGWMNQYAFYCVDVTLQYVRLHYTSRSPNTGHKLYRENAVDPRCVDVTWCKSHLRSTEFGWTNTYALYRVCCTLQYLIEYLNVMCLALR